MSPRQGVAPAAGDAAPGAATTAEHELQRLETELALLEDDNRRLKSKLEGSAMESQKNHLLQLREVLSQKADEMSMLGMFTDYTLAQH